MDTRTLLLVLSPLIVINVILMIAVIVSIARKTIPWGQKWPWLLLIFVSTFGPIIYFVVGSRILDEKSAEGNDNQ